MTAHLRRVESRLFAHRPVGHRLPVRRLAGSDRAARQAGEAKADNGVVATACLYRDAASCGRPPSYSDAAKTPRTSRTSPTAPAHCVQRALREAGRHDPQRRETAYALAIVFGLLDEETVRLPGSGLRRSWPRAATTSRPGSLARHTVTDALSATGHIDEAYRLLLQRECPSWLYPVTMGATTIWERWDSMLPDGTINPGQMTSFNHYALGAVADWIHRSIGGIAPLEPGYSKVLIAPQPGGDIRWAKSSLETRHGKISASLVTGRRRPHRPGHRRSGRCCGSGPPGSDPTRVWQRSTPHLLSSPRDGVKGEPIPSRSVDSETFQSVGQQCVCWLESSALTADAAWAMRSQSG